MNSFYTMQL